MREEITIDSLPKPGLLDKLTSIDDWLKLNYLGLYTIANLLAAQPKEGDGGLSLPTQSLVGLKGQLENLQTGTYRIWSTALDAALVDSLVVGEGFNMVGVSDGVMDAITVKLNNLSNDAIPLKHLIPAIQPFSKFYVTSPAQAGKTLWIAISRIPGQSFEVNQKGVSTAKGQQTIYNVMVPGIGTYYATNTDWRTGKRLCIYAVSTMDTACTIQAFGNKTNLTTNISLIGVPRNIAIGSVTTQVASIPLNGDDLWHPFIGVRIVTLAAATLGTLLITVDAQE